MFTPQELEEIRKADRLGRPKLTPEQREASAEKRRAWYRARYAAHREEILAKRREKARIPEEREKNIRICRMNHKFKRKVILEKRKQYYKDNRDIIIARQMKYYWAKKEAARLLAQTERPEEYTQIQFSTVSEGCQCG